MGGASGLRVGVIGVGRIGTAHARTLLELPGVASVAVADADPARAARVASGLGAEAVALEQVLAEVDAVAIATATSGHAALLRLAVAAGVPAFCEKPVAHELAVLEALVGDLAGAFVQVGFQRRFDAGYRAARDAVATGALGTLLVLRAASHDPAPPVEAVATGSGGIFWDLLIHDIDAIRFVTGEEIVEVYADGAVRESRWLERVGDVDVGVAVLRLSGGARAIVSGTRRDAVGYDVRLELFGTGNSLAVGLDARTPLRSAEPGEPGPPGRPYVDFLDRFAPAYRAELGAFVAAVGDG